MDSKINCPRHGAQQSCINSTGGAAERGKAGTRPAGRGHSALTEDEGDLDLGQVEEVLGDVDGDLVQEGRGDVEAILDVVQVAASLQAGTRALACCIDGRESSAPCSTLVAEHILSTSPSWPVC